MNGILSRRRFTQALFAAAALAAVPLKALAANREAFEADDASVALRELFGDKPVIASEDFEFKVPDIAEDGSIVPVTVATDMEGVKFRAYNNAMSRLAELTGMLPVTIEAAEISQAFATGVAESMVSSGSTGYDRKVWESLTHFYEVDAWLPRNAVFVNLDAWNGLSDETKAVMEDCAAKAKAEGLHTCLDVVEREPGGDPPDQEQRSSGEEMERLARGGVHEGNEYCKKQH